MHLFLKVFLFSPMVLYPDPKGFVFVDFYGDCLGHTNMNRQLFCFLILAFFLLFIFFVIPIIVRTVRPGGGQN